MHLKFLLLLNEKYPNHANDCDCVLILFKKFWIKKDFNSQILKLNYFLNFFKRGEVGVCVVCAERVYDMKITPATRENCFL